MNQFVQAYFKQKIHAAPLAVFRIFFGLLMLGSLLRFYINGWIDKLYLQPQFFFSYYGFEWVKPLGAWTYLVFLIAGIASLFITLGWYYRLSMITFFLSFTYIELMDKTTYLNHYYFVSLLSFLLIFLPANAYFSVDAWKNSVRSFEWIPRWCIDSIKLLLSIVYFYAGLAKLNSDWIMEAMPLKIWLTSKYDLPFIGSFVHQNWVHYFFSWSGAAYDLAIPFLLWWRPTRGIAFLAVVVFHLMTGWLFPIGMFPYIMIVSALIFFEPPFHQQLLNPLRNILKYPRELFENNRMYFFPNRLSQKFTQTILLLFFVGQLIIPFRYLLYPGELFWTEEGYRFSWRVMLMEKAGYAQFKVVDPKTGKQFRVDNSTFLTPFQEKQMSTQPDFILEYAQFLAKYHQTKGIENPEIYVDSYVALNGRSSQPYIDPTVDLTKIQDKWPRKWVLPFNDIIYGL